MLSIRSGRRTIPKMAISNNLLDLGLLAGITTRPRHSSIDEPLAHSFCDLFEFGHRHAHIILVDLARLGGCFGEQLSEGPELAELVDGLGLCPRCDQVTLVGVQSFQEIF